MKSVEYCLICLRLLCKMAEIISFWNSEVLTWKLFVLWL